MKVWVVTDGDRIWSIHLTKESAKKESNSIIWYTRVEEYEVRD